MQIDNAYAVLIHHCLGERPWIETRNSRCKRVTGWRTFIDSTPLISVRRTAWKNALREWEWFMSGSNSIDDLHADVRKWWTPWADADGRVKYNYSEQLRDKTGRCDQIDYFVGGVRDHPFSRRNVITTWNTYDMTREDCKITNCHSTIVQAFVETDNTLDLVTYQRSADIVCGLPHNWVQMWAFLLWLCHRTGRVPGHVLWIGGDCHVYEDHMAMAERIVASHIRVDATPQLVYTPTSEDFKADDFKLDRPYRPVIEESVAMVV